MTPEPSLTFWSRRPAPSLDDFEAMAKHAFESLPPAFRERVADLTISVDDLPADDVLSELGLESPFDLLGLFEGIGLPQAPAVPDSGTRPNRISIYRRPILDYWAEHDDTLEAIVTHVLIHEIGHHFGLSDEDMEAIERGDAEDPA